MKFWVDAQLPPSLASWLSACHGVEAHSLRDLGMRDDDDRKIFDAARQAGVVIISKDSDFVDLVSRYGTPPQLLWVTCGNVTNKKLQAVFDQTFTEAKAALSAGQAIIEVG